MGPPPPPLERQQQFKIDQSIQGINTSMADPVDERRGDSYGRELKPRPTLLSSLEGSAKFLLLPNT